jgi:hypothetical protein
MMLLVDRPVTPAFSRLAADEGRELLLAALSLSQSDSAECG